MSRILPDNTEFKHMRPHHFDVRDDYDTFYPEKTLDNANDTAKWWCERFFRALITLNQIFEKQEKQLTQKKESR